MCRHPNTNRLAAIAVLLLGALCCGCGSEASDDGRPCVLVVSGDTDGWIVPCGCAAKQAGGLPRRATYVGQLRKKAHVIVADVGGAPHDVSDYDRVKFEAILRGEMAMDIAAHNIGAGEAAMGADTLRELAKRLGVPFHSPHVRDTAGELVAQPVRIVEAGRRRIALIGVLDPSYATDQIRVEEPRQAILDAIEGPAADCDHLVVLAYMPYDALRALAETLPEVDAVLGGPTGQPVQPELLGPTLLASATNKGKFVARLDVPTSDPAGRFSGSIVELGDQFADDSAQIANLNRYYDELAEHDFTPSQTALVDPLRANLPADFAIAGTESCRECHSKECDTWDKSGHASAWNSLTEKNAHVDPDCQRCHTTGYGFPGGFVSAKKSAASRNVGCEDCHGPSKAHAADETVRTPHFGRAADHCRTCHDRENSPHFDFDEYWAKIRHAKPTNEG